MIPNIIGCTHRSFFIRVYTHQMTIAHTMDNSQTFAGALEVLQKGRRIWGYRAQGHLEIQALRINLDSMTHRGSQTLKQQSEACMIISQGYSTKVEVVQSGMFLRLLRVGVGVLLTILPSHRTLFLLLNYLAQHSYQCLCLDLLYPVVLFLLIYLRGLLFTKEKQRSSVSWGKERQWPVDRGRRGLSSPEY